MEGPFMRKQYIISSLIILLITMTVVPLFADDQEILIINKTGYDGHFLYLSPQSSDSWKEDVLGDQILANGDRITITITGYGDECIFDVKLEDQDGDTYTKFGLNICDMGKIVFTLEDIDVDSEYDGMQDFTLINNIGFMIFEIYVSPETSDDWEENILGDDILEPGEEYNITFTGYDECIFDIMIVDEDGDTYTKMEIDLCSDYEVIFTLDDLD